MTIYVGGTRARLIKDSTFYTVFNGLTALGWFDAGRHHQAVTFLAQPQNPNVEIPVNTLALADEEDSDTFDEMGSQFSEHRWGFYVDFFAESDVLGLHLIRDVKDILEGRMPSIGRNGPSVQVFDYTMTTPTYIFYCDIEQVRIDRAHNFPQPWLRHWYSCSFQVVDHYGSETDGQEAQF